MIERQTNIPLTIVVAMAKNRVIGHQGGLPWQLPADLKWFRKVTMGKPVIMGRKTFDSIGKALPGRDNIVITRNSNFSAPEVTVASDLEDAIAIAEAFAINREVNGIAIIGGAQVYEQALPLVSRLYVTEVEADIEGDAFFPDYDLADWSQTEEQVIEPDERHAHRARMLVLDRNF